MSTRDLARSLGLRKTAVNRELLDLQRRNLVRRNGTRWQALTARQLGAPNVLPADQRPNQNSRLPSRTPHPRGGDQQASLPPTAEEADGPLRKSLHVDRTNSRWNTFRRLCEYYAECVRLDQRSTIHAKADEEFDSIVCLDGRLPDADDWVVRTRSSWNAWMRNATATDYLFVGYPLQRYAWRDASNSQEVTFITPLFVAPCRYRIRGTELLLQQVSGIRVNEGWLERRLPNLDQRRAFLELVGSVDVDALDDDAPRRSWSDYTRLLNHYYHDWCAETLDPQHICSAPSLQQLQRDGLYNRAALIVPRKWRFTNRLYQELLALAHEKPDEQLDASALACIFPFEPPNTRLSVESADQPENDALVGASPLTLNHEQQQAIDAAAKQPLSIVVGPPGTGKSRVVAAALAQQTLLGRNALFASRNHQALEAVVPRINAMTEPWPSMLRLSRPWGAAVDESLEAAISELVASDRQYDRRRLEQLRTALARRLEEQRDANRTIDLVTQVRQEIDHALFEIGEHHRDVPEPYRQYTFFPELADPAAIAHLITALTPPGKFRLSFAHLFHWLRFKLQWRKYMEAARKIDQSFRGCFDAAATLPPPPGDVSLDVADFYLRGLLFWRPVAEANMSLQRLATLQAEAARQSDVDDVCRDAWVAVQEAATLAADCCQELAIQSGCSLSNDERRELADILAAMRNRSGLDDESDRRRWEDAMRRSFPLFLRHCPLVATTNLSVGRDISLQPGVFDLLVVDEASQCDIASVIPLLFRARRAMIVGDPMQLSHVTSLAAATDRHLRRQFGVDSHTLERFSYRTTSMFHLANTSDRVGARTSLRQHHRCHPAIAEYCNESFYRGSWVVLTESGKAKGLRWTDVPDDSQPAPGGGAMSENQMQQIRDELLRLADEGFQGTVGVVTPFRRQADRMRDRLFESIPKATIDAWRLLVSTADGFQGDERDVVLLSLVAGENLTDGSLRFLAGGPNRFNVAVSRARRLLHVFGDATWAGTCNIAHIRRLVEACRREEQLPEGHGESGFREDLVGPVWEPALANALREAGIPFFQQYPASGRYLDFAFFRDGLKLNVEVDGETYHRSPGGGHVEADIRRDQALIAAGWKIKRFWVYQLREDMRDCIEQISAAYNSAS